MRDEIDKFLYKMHLMSLAVLVDEKPYCSSAFYAYDSQSSIFVIAGGLDSTHIQAALKNNHISGTIALDTKVVGKIQGMQFCGEIRSANAHESAIYFKRFPFAKIMNPTLFAIEINYVKFTDNTLGFGKKLIWKR